VAGDGDRFARPPGEEREHARGGAGAIELFGDRKGEQYSVIVAPDARRLTASSSLARSSARRARLHTGAPSS
jgi:hypothetical protein